MLRIVIIFIAFLTANIAIAQSALAVEKVVITVSDLKVSTAFYQEILKFNRVQSYTLNGPEFQQLMGLSNKDLSVAVVEMQLGDEVIALQEFSNEEESRAIPLDSKSNDLWFQHMAIVVSDMDKAYEQLWKAGVVHVSTSPQTLPDYIPAAAGIKAFYFQDPDGHNLELIYFPEGKGDEKWHKKNSPVFMGIDHTAIVVENTLDSTEFYEELLGLKLMGHSENFGPEQEHLNQVFGARLWISGLRAKSGMGVEFLEYIAPPGGRPFPENSSATDLWHWHSVIRVVDVQKIYEKLKKENAIFISNEVKTIRKQQQFMIRDSNGHAVLLIE
jgi:catechol 2,3-dioxygenase-like lactoylglutathione lyase family enzyme